MAVWGLSGYILATYKQINSFSVAYLTWLPAVIMIFIGVIFLVAGISGCVTSCGGSRRCSFTVSIGSFASQGCHCIPFALSLQFFLFVFLTFVALVTAITLIFVYKRQIDYMVDEDANATFSEYGQPGYDALTKQVDYVQTRVSACCFFLFFLLRQDPFSVGMLRYLQLYVLGNLGMGT